MANDIRNELEQLISFVEDYPDSVDFSSISDSFTAGHHANEDFIARITGIIPAESEELNKIVVSFQKPLFHTIVVAMQAMKQKKDDFLVDDQLVTVIAKLKVWKSDYEQLGEAVVKKSAEDRVSEIKQSFQLIQDAFSSAIDHLDC